MKRQRAASMGFTMIELMVTLAIIAILAAFAIPSYQEQVRKTRRAEARQELMKLAAAQERFYTNCNSYAKTLNGDQTLCEGLSRPAATATSEHGFYKIELDGDGATYTVTATPQAAQVDDTKCGTFTLTDAGVKGASGTLGAAECW
ncbi:MAG: prepilin-type N-terminal cleavage/methylation domain-containing protein [Xanthomonadales bacterium]|nr:prepilin-type N-terminal cleavage/methylation domain-containing protein [Xanthomonadales bacterium]